MIMSPPPPAQLNSNKLQQNKLLGLQVIRFICALSVLIWHYQHFFYIADKPENFIVELQPFYAFLSLFYNYGLYGVQIFWCISGFIFFYKYKNEIAGKLINYKKFFVLRFSRLYPLHVSTLLLVALLQYVYLSEHDYYFVYQNNDALHFFLQMFFASNWLSEMGYSFNGPIWSISIEVLIYFIFFMMLRYVGKSVLISIFIVVVCVGARAAKVNSPIVDCMSFFYIGGISAIAFQFFNNTKYKKLMNGLAFCGLFLLPVIAFLTNFYKHTYWFLLAYTPILLFVASDNYNVHPAIRKSVETAGNMTYSSYLIHFPIQLMIAIYFSHLNHAIPYYNTSFFTTFIFMTLFCSYYMYRLFEMPAQKYFRNKFK